MGGGKGRMMQKHRTRRGTAWDVPVLQRRRIMASQPKGLRTMYLISSTSCGVSGGRRGWVTSVRGTDGKNIL